MDTRRQPAGTGRFESWRPAFGRSAAFGRFRLLLVYLFRVLELERPYRMNLPPLLVGLPVIHWRDHGARSGGPAALCAEGGGVEPLPLRGWVHFCTQCTRPTSQRLLIITCRRGGEMHSVVICRACLGGNYDRFSEHACFVVRQEHLRAPLRDVNAEADRCLAEYARAEAERKANEARERDRVSAELNEEDEEDEERRRRKRCSLQ